ncbi:MAG: chemotaxis protein CheA [Bacteroidales bacterium]|nr:chemotaxis protein CheA [Bacteroidales bacterium]
MDNFRNKFIEEALEHLNDLEGTLLLLEQDPENKELIEKVFRSMHSLKGGGAMFGFELISEFTHNLENIYDLVRNGEMYISKDLLDVTLAAVDHLKNLIDDQKVELPQTQETHTKLLSKIDAILETKSALKITKDISKDKKNTETISSATTKTATYYILFQPNENIFDNGTNPLYLIDELYNLGQAIAIPHFNRLPEFDELIPTRCYTYWEVILSTSQPFNAISDVFIFVEDDCHIDIHKLSDYNLLENNEFYSFVQQAIDRKTDIGIDNLQTLASRINAAIMVKEKKTDERLAVSKENTISSIRVSSEKLDVLMNLVSELVTTQARLSLFSEHSNNNELIAIAENVQKLSRQLRDIAFSIVLIPIENLMTRFQRLVRDLSQELKKEVQFIAEGTETELDKTIIENLTDPLLHILRNSLDHGIEDPAIRVKHGKPRLGTIMLKAYYSGANVHIQISDDGAGIDTEKIRQKAISKGLITPDAVLSHKELLEFIFMPGFSTANNITEVSGRGVGMDVVRRKIADIRGEVEVESKLGFGTTTTIKLPLTLSIIDGLLVKIHDTFYIIPLSSVDKIYAAEHNKVVGTFNQLIVLDGQQIPFFYLRHEFELEENNAPMEQIIVVRYEDKRIGLVVDSVVGEYQAVLKPLGKYYKNQEIISGATILGDGTIALVIDTNKAIKYFARKYKVEEVK